MNADTSAAPTVTRKLKDFPKSSVRDRLLALDPDTELVIPEGKEWAWGFHYRDLNKAQRELYDKLPRCRALVIDSLVNGAPRRCSSKVWPDFKYCRVHLGLAGQRGLNRKGPRCAALSRASLLAGRPRRCLRTATPGFSVCAYHGSGYFKRGKMSGAMPTTGKYSKYFKGSILERYEDFLENHEYLAMRDEIAALDSRSASLITQLSAGGSEFGVGVIKKGLRVVREALNTPDPATREEALSRGLAVLEAATAAIEEDAMVWDELKKIFKLRSQLVETEMRRYEKAQQSITVEQAMAMLASVVDVINRFVPEPSTRANIAAGLRAIMVGRADRAVGRPQQPAIRTISG